MRVLPLMLLAAVAVAETNWDAAGKAWWSHVRFLADDKLAGRDVGSAGFETAANYVVSQFKRAGLETDSQAVEFTKSALNEAGSGVTLVGDGPVKLGDEVLISSTANVSG